MPKIPIKKYEPNLEVLSTIDEVLDGRFPYDHQRRMTDLALEYRALEKHHKDETEWLLQRIKELELQAKD